MVRPYKQIKEGEKIVRTFSNEVSEDELVWHRDIKNRCVPVLSGKGWHSQMDDKLTVNLMIGQDYYITKNTYHRVIKGETNLVIRIENI